MSMEVNNTETMQVLLNALNLKFAVDDNTITIQSSKKELIHSIVSSEEDVQNVYKNTSEWREIIKLI